MAVLLKILLGGNFVEKLNLLWSACSNYNGTNILENRVAIILFDIIKCDKNFMKFFCQDVLKATNFLPQEVESAKVDMGTHNFDLFIQTDRQIIPIELKIDARDQDKQCHRYLQTAREINKNIPARLYYLTKDKHKPSENSLNGEKILANDLKTAGNDDGVILISYQDEILNWLESCSQDLKNNGENYLSVQLEFLKDMIKENL